MQILGDGRSNTDLRDTQPLHILIAEANITEPLQCS
jgi:hypothetical protein